MTDPTDPIFYLISVFLMKMSIRQNTELTFDDDDTENNFAEEQFQKFLTTWYNPTKGKEYGSFELIDMYVRETFSKKDPTFADELLNRIFNEN